MTATDFRELLAGWLEGPLGPSEFDLGVADEILAMPVPWVDCPTCHGNWDIGTSPPCPACAGTGHATVAQLLAWGSAVAQPVTDWGNYHLAFDDLAVDAVNDYRNQILDTQP